MVEDLAKLDRDLKECGLNVAAGCGFDARKNIDWLESRGIARQICPKDPKVLRERLDEDSFHFWQTRWAGTEARIAIFKNHADGRVWRAKGLEYRRVEVVWSRSLPFRHRPSPRKVS